ncbi:MAG TPA: hypothetical protein ENL20_09835 [Candidatus Cloacimonetes bacterium]|nr:hypothetical protein [Candidatus Cloacimonadota bacterium]
MLYGYESIREFIENKKQDDDRYRYQQKKWGKDRLQISCEKLFISKINIQYKNEKKRYGRQRTQSKIP